VWRPFDLTATVPTVDFATFSRLCIEEGNWLKDYDDLAEGYIKKHLVRFYETYQMCAKVITPNSRVLSVGAGIAIVERQLRKLIGCEIVVLDEPEAIETKNDTVYSRDNLKKIGIDLTQPWNLSEPLFDLVISGEVLEHLTIPPIEHIKPLVHQLKPSGHIVLSTPNLGSLAKILGLLRGRPIFNKPEDFFLPVTGENSWIHRREYVASEVTSAMVKAGLTVVDVQYIFNRTESHPTLVSWARVPLYAINPRFKPTLLISARK
jgi:2-polyprenyl-3-methyl-5-hydroxy-6-metoxy-1,4-benzoquinol methylase